MLDDDTSLDDETVLDEDVSLDELTSLLEDTSLDDETALDELSSFGGLDEDEVSSFGGLDDEELSLEVSSLDEVSSSTLGFETSVASGTELSNEGFSGGYDDESSITFMSELDISSFELPKQPESEITKAKISIIATSFFKLSPLFLDYFKSLYQLNYAVNRKIRQSLISLGFL